MINDFEKEVECTYKGETYSVRDNGSVLRHPHIGKKPRPTDNVWTFGKYNAQSGYAEIAGERVHRIVATAFHGETPSPQHVVDHIDTNRRNNRPENLRWITKLENILLNAITVRRIELAYGSIEEFLKDPSKPKQNYITRDFEWMRAVSKEEAAASLERLQSWAQSDKPLFGGSLGEWIYTRGANEIIVEKEELVEEEQNEIDNNLLEEAIAATEAVRKSKPVRNSTTNPFNFPRVDKENIANTVVMYRTNEELLSLLKSKLEFEKKIKLPNIKLPTAGNGIVIKESWTEEFQECEFYYEGKARTPKSVILHCKDESFALLIRKKSSSDENEIYRLKSQGYNIVELDLSWTRNGVTELEMEYLLQTDITKKNWVHHEQIDKAREIVKKICEPIAGAGRGVLHSYIACPRYSKGIQDIDCWYCDYRISYKVTEDGKTYDCDRCFGKSGVQTYEELLSITNVETEDDKVISISFDENGETVTKRFNKDVELSGKTIFQLWVERKGNTLVAHNINSDWYVLIEKDPKKSFEETGEVYGRLGRSVEDLKSSPMRSIFSLENYCWEAVKV